MKKVKYKWKKIKICKNCGHTYGWHNDLGFCCKCSSFNKPCWELIEGERKMKNESAN